MIFITKTTVYGRDLRYKEMMMMEAMMKLPDDMFKQELLPYLTVQDIVNLDNACMNHKYRSQLMDKISGVILLGDKDKSMKALLFKWLGMRRIYLMNMNLIFEVENPITLYTLTPSSIYNDYVNQFRYTRHIVMRGAIRDVTTKFIISYCPCLLSMVVGDCKVSSHQITNKTLQLIAEHCTGRLQSLSFKRCGRITDTGLITISEHCPNLKSLKLYYCHEITDASIISISTHCTGLKLLNLRNCDQITDASIISISSHCTGLQSLDLWLCCQISDVSIIPISENCTGLKSLVVSWVKITDASLIAIAKNCNELQLLDAFGCNGLSSHKLRQYFQSVSKLRAVLLSIYPSLPI